MTLRITIVGEPVGQGRGRAGLVRDKGGRPVLSKRGEPIIRVHDPEKSRSWKATAQDHMAPAMAGRPLLDGALCVRVLAVFTCPRSSWRKREPLPRRPHTGRPDLENVVKAVLDAGTGVLWVDDSQVAVLEARKLRGAQGEAPFVELEVEPLEELNAAPRPAQVALLGAGAR